MAVTWRRVVSIYNSTGALINSYDDGVPGATPVINGTAEVEFSPLAAIAASTTYHIAGLNLPFAKIQGYSLYSPNKTVTLRVNDPTTSVDGDIVLTAGVPREFPGEANVFGHTITDLYIVNGSGAVATPVLWFNYLAT